MTSESVLSSSLDGSYFMQESRGCRKVKIQIWPKNVLILKERQDNFRLRDVQEWMFSATSFESVGESFRSQPT